MLTRRGFVGCALCALTGFAATEVGAQTTGLKRTILSRMDGPMAGYETIEARVEAEPGAIIARHTHFGIETSYLVEGSVELEIVGEGSKTYAKGDAFQVPAGAVHGGKVGSNGPMVLSGVYVVEKGKPLATPA